jgi:uncharacterized protein YecA (UPF0149 family)
MLDSQITTQQLAVIDALSSGVTIAEAAAEAGIHRNTIAYWRRTMLPFREALSHANYEKALAFREQSEQLAPLAFQAIRQILENEAAPASVRLKAALAIIQTATTPPPPAPEPASTSELEPIQNPPEMHKNAQHEVHKNAQTDRITPITPIRRDHPKIGRNEQCPCGSGQKFKRCCLNKLFTTGVQ